MVRRKLHNLRNYLHDDDEDGANNENILNQVTNNCKPGSLFYQYPASTTTKEGPFPAASVVDRTAPNSIIKLAYQSYTLKRGAATNSFHAPAYRQAHDTPYRRLLTELARCTNDLLRVSSQPLISSRDPITNIAQVSIILTAMVKLVNDRCALLWRGEQSSAAVGVACCLHDDVVATVEVLAASVHGMCLSLKEGGVAVVGMRQVHAPWKAIVWRFIKQITHLQMFVWPGIFDRIEAYVRSAVRNDATKTYAEILRSESFLGRGVTRSASLSGRDQGRLLSKGSSAIDSYSTDVKLINVLNGNIFDVLLATISESCGSNDFSAIRLLSTCFNATLDCLLDYLLVGRYRFSHQGVVILYSLLAKIQEKVIAARNSFHSFELLSTGSAATRSALLATLTNYHHRGPVTSTRAGAGVGAGARVADRTFSLIQDRRPWIRANCVLSILQTGQSASCLSPDPIVSNKSNNDNNNSNNNSYNKHAHNHTANNHGIRDRPNVSVSLRAEVDPVRPLSVGPRASFCASPASPSPGPKPSSQAYRTLSSRDDFPWWVYDQRSVGLEEVLHELKIAHCLRTKNPQRQFFSLTEDETKRWMALAAGKNNPGVIFAQRFSLDLKYFLCPLLCACSADDVHRGGIGGIKTRKTATISVSVVLDLSNL